MNEWMSCAPSPCREERMSEMWEFLPSSCGCGRPKASWDGCFPVPHECAGDSRGGAEGGGGYWNVALLLGWDCGCRVELTMPELVVLSWVWGEGHLSRPQGVPMEPGGHRWCNLLKRGKLSCRGRDHWLICVSQGSLGQWGLGVRRCVPRRRQRGGQVA